MSGDTFVRFVSNQSLCSWEKKGKSGHSVFIHTIKTTSIFLCISEFDLNAQLCTYKKTSDECHYQQFYICNTCDIYVCIVCKEVCDCCHHGHDLEYIGFIPNDVHEYGAYCECGEKGNESCKALTPRTSMPDADTVEKEPIASCPLQPNQGKDLNLVSL